MTTKNNKEIIIEELDKWLYFHCIGENTHQSALESFATSLLAKLNIPEEGKLVADGICRAYPSGFEIGDKALTKVNEEIFKHQDKEIQIIIKQKHNDKGD